MAAALWSELPDLVLDNLVMRLPNPVDFSSFRRVCRNWRKIAKSAEAFFLRSLPQLICELETGRFYDTKTGAVYAKRDSAGRPLPRMNLEICSSHSHGYLILVEESRSGDLVSRRFYLRDILTCEETLEYYPVLEHGKDLEDKILWAGLSAAPTSPTSLLVVLYRNHCLISSSKKPWQITDLKAFVGSGLDGAAVMTTDRVLMALDSSKQKICNLKLNPDTTTSVDVAEVVGIHPDIVNMEMLKLRSGLHAYGRQGPDLRFYELDYPNKRWLLLLKEQCIKRGLIFHDCPSGFQVDRKLICVSPGNFSRM